MDHRLSPGPPRLADVLEGLLDSDHLGAMATSKSKTKMESGKSSRRRGRAERNQVSPETLKLLGLSSEDVDRVVEGLWQKMKANGTGGESFGDFEAGLLEVSNNVSQQLIKKNSSK